MRDEFRFGCPDVAIGSDGMPLLPDDGLGWDTPYEEFPNTHPRFAGSFAKVLRIARDNGIPLIQAIAMTRYNYAKAVGGMGLKAMQVRGRLEEGMAANTTIFDPKTVTDNATYAKGTLPSTGIPHVIVRDRRSCGRIGDSAGRRCSRAYANLRIPALDRSGESCSLADRMLPIAVPHLLTWGSSIAHSSDAVLVVDESGNVVLASEGACALFKYSADELCGCTIELLIPHGSRAAHIGHRLRFIDDRRTRPMGTGLELFALCKDGSECRVDIGLKTVQRGLRTLTVATIRKCGEPF